MRRALPLLLALAIAAPVAAEEAAPPAEGAPPTDAAAELAEKNRLRGRDAVEDAEVRALVESMEAYEEESKLFKKEVQALIEKRYGQKRAQLAENYERLLGKLEQEERKERLDAIAMFEEFLQRYPSDQGYTPDAMFRLAELYYERSKDESVAAMAAYEEKLKQVEGGGIKDAGEAPRADFRPSIGLYERLIRDWPDYKLIDASLYLLAYSYEQQEDPEKSRETYLALIDRFPSSRFVPEAWVRMGEYWFEAEKGDATENLKKAAEAYGKMLSYPEHSLYDEAIYKLGWTYYRLDEYDAAVREFVRVIDFYDDEAKKKGEEVGGDLRKESMQYTAISFTDEKWGSIAKAEGWFKANGARPWEPELYRQIGDILYDIQRKDDRGYPTSVDAYRLFLTKDPTNPEAPQVQAKIVAALSRERLFEDETKEREKLVALYDVGGAWHEKNKGDSEVIAAAGELTEQALKVAAIFHHQQAQQFKKDGKLLDAFREYKAAAKAYGEYLGKFPNSKEVYELTYYWAECLYNSTEFLAAARQYERVRDLEGESKYLADAAFAAVLSYQKQMEREIAEGKLKVPPVRLSKDRPEGQGVTPQGLDPSLGRFIKAADLYDSKVPPDENSPAIMFKAAELYFAHDEFEEARRRLEGVIVKFPKDPVSQSAANLIIETYLVTKDWVNVQVATAKFLERKDLELDPELKANLYTFRLGAIYKQADKLMADKKYDEAGTEYLRLVQEKPDHEFADKALNNAAVCFENTERFDSAVKTYERIINEYPKSTFADAALFRVAENSRKSYDFDKAVARYGQLVKDYPQSKDRANAINNLAGLLVGLQRYDEGARTFQRFAELYPNDPDAPKNQYNAAVVYERQEDWKKLVPALEAFIRKFGNDPKQNELVVRSKLKVAKAYVALKNERGARAAYEETTREFEKRYGGKMADPAAAAAAAEAAFMLAEYEFAAWDKLKIEGSKKALEASFKKKKDKVKELRDKYLAVAKFKNVDWTLAAFYRKAYLFERLANSFFEAPIPPEVARLGVEAEDLYRSKIAEAVVALEDQAVKDYEETLVQSRKFGISNEWTRRTLEALNRYRPKEYPILKEATTRLERSQDLPSGLAPTITGYPEAPPELPPEPPPAPPAEGGKPPAAPADIGAGGVKAGGAAEVPAPPAKGSLGLGGVKAGKPADGKVGK